MIDIGVLRAMAAAGATVEVILATIEADQKQVDARKAERLAKDAARKREERKAVRERRASAGVRNVRNSPADVLDAAPKTAENVVQFNGIMRPLDATDAPAKNLPYNPSNNKERKKDRLGCRLPSDWLACPADVQFARDQGMNDLAIADQENRFRDYWHAAPGAKGRKADWPATWRNWIRNSQNFRQQRSAGNGTNGTSLLAACDRLERHLASRIEAGANGDAIGEGDLFLLPAR